MVSDDPAVVVSTLLGSCVACCLWDPLAQLGGVNHMLLAQVSDSRATSNDAGVNAMELLINDILKRGGMRNRLVAKVFGGAQMVRGLSDIGKTNSDFTFDFLSRENMECVSQSVGGQQARHLHFWPATGAARQKFVLNTQELVTLPPVVPIQPVEGNGLELF